MVFAFWKLIKLSSLEFGFSSNAVVFPLYGMTLGFHPDKYIYQGSKTWV
jgi:hypothetical protein